VLADRSGRLEELVGGLELALRGLLRGGRRAQTIQPPTGLAAVATEREARGAQARKSGTLSLHAGLLVPIDRGSVLSVLN
jgi:hypothetical protein